MIVCIFLSLILYHDPEKALMFYCFKNYYELFQVFHLVYEKNL